MRQRPDWPIQRPWRLRFEMRVERPAPEGGLTPVELPGLDLEAIAPGPGLADPDSFVLVRCDSDTGTPHPFDPDRSGVGVYELPYRFVADYEGRALPAAIRRGTLAFPAPSHVGTYRYHLYFACHEGRAGGLSYHGVVGDGDALVQTAGALTVNGCAEPTAYGRGFFGRRGLLLGASYGPVRFFEDTSADGQEPALVELGPLKDSRGAEITGTPQLVDWDGDGRLSLVVGNADTAKLYLHCNLGTNSDPVLSPGEPLRHTDGSDIGLVDYLKDIEVPCIRADGTPNPVYPRMRLVRVHGGHIHLHAAAQFVDLTGGGNVDLLVGTRGDFVLYFRREGDRFRRGQFVRDETGTVIRPGGFIHVVDRRPDAPLALIAGRSLGHVDWWELAGAAGGVPVFRNRGPLSVEGEPLHEAVQAFPLLIECGCGPGLIVGNWDGQLRHHRISGWEDGLPRLGPGELLRTPHARVLCHMAACHYGDLDGDGRKDLLAGSITGSVDYCRNLGTDRNPVFDERRYLRAEDGPIRIRGGPDPTHPEDGYSKPTPCDLTGDGRTDLVAGTGLGRVCYFRNLGNDLDGHPLFARPRVLHDTAGNEVMSHHMSSVDVGDWDRDGAVDLLVGGQPNVHGVRDDDPDPDTRVRWYRGVGRGEDGMAQFAPYVAFEAQGDREIAHRPKPRIGVWRGEHVLFCHHMIFRATSGTRPEQLAFIGTLPPMLSHARRNVIPADFTFSSLAADDPVVIQASCMRYVFLFRRAFVLNRGYLDASFNLGGVESGQGRPGHSVGVAIDEPPWRIPLPARGLDRKTYEAPRACPSGLTGPAAGWAAVPARDDLTTRSLILDGDASPVGRCVAVQVAWSPGHLHLRVRCDEPCMDRLIDRASSDNAYSITTDEHVAVLVALGETPELAHHWAVTPSGHRRESFARTATGEAVGRPAGLSGARPVHVRSSRAASAWTVQLTIPFERFGTTPAPGQTWSVNVWRNRSLYADETRAAEQREAESIDWSGAGPNVWGSVRLVLTGPGSNAAV